MWFKERKMQQVRDKERIAELSAEANKWCEDWGDAQKRIAELKAQVESLIADWNKEHPKRLDAEAEVARLEAKTNAAIDHMTEVGVDACRKRDERIAELTAHAADCKRLVTACEDDLDAERMKRREAEAALRYMTIERDSLTEDRDDLIRLLAELEAALGRCEELRDAYHKMLMEGPDRYRARAEAAEKEIDQ